VPRSTQAEIEFSKRRDAVGLLEASGIASARISADSVWANAGPPFAFYRGGARIIVTLASRTSTTWRTAQTRLSRLDAPPLSLRREGR
jgi:hypothetical protein